MSVLVAVNLYLLCAAVFLQCCHQASLLPWHE